MTQDPSRTKYERARCTAGAFQRRLSHVICWELVLVILLIIFLLGGVSGRFGGYGYGFGHTGVGLIGTILIILVVLMLIGRL